MATIPQNVRDALTRAPLVHMVTLNRDGSPQVTGVWLGVDSDTFVTAHLGKHQKVRNVERDGRVVLSFATGQIGPRGLEEYCVIYGRAHVEDGGAPAILRNLARIYMGTDVRFPPMEDPPPGLPHPHHPGPLRRPRSLGHGR